MFFVFVLFAISQCQQSICDKYSKALKLTNKALVSTVVTAVVGKVTATGTNTLKYFDGEKPKGSLNFLDKANNASLTALVDSLVSFFGAALGCSDGTISAYTGPTMAKVHQPMGIKSAEFTFFNMQVLAVLTSAGVSPGDVATVGGVLNSLKKDIVSQTICDRYADALKISDKQLVTNVVVGTFGKITAPTSPILKFFNGVQPPGSTDFINKNKNALPGLVNGLVTFFGSALGCHDMSIGPYVGPDMKAVHGAMGIKNDEFNLFNFQLLSVLRAAGVAMPDLRAVDGVLNSTRTAIVSA